MKSFPKESRKSDAPMSYCGTSSVPYAIRVASRSGAFETA